MLPKPLPLLIVQNKRLVPVQAQLLPPAQPPLDVRLRRRVKRNCAGPIALAVSHSDGAVAEVQIRDLERERLAYAEAGAEHGRDQGGVSDAGRSATAGSDQGDNLRSLEYLSGQLRPLVHRDSRLCRVHGSSCLLVTL